MRSILTVFALCGGWLTSARAQDADSPDVPVSVEPFVETGSSAESRSDAPPATTSSDGALSNLELGARKVPVAEQRTGATPLQVTFIAPVRLMFWTGVRQDLYGLGIAVIYETSRQAHGLSIAGIYNAVDQRVIGAQIGGLVAINDGSLLGLQVGGFYAKTSRDARGLQIAGLKTVHAGVHARGISIAGLKNESLADFDGIQIAGLVNETSGRLTRAVQIAALNFNEADVYKGVQAGAFNVVKGDFTGIAMGAANMALRPSGLSEFGHVGDVTGVQIGIVNVGSWVRGAQIGVVNIARSGLTGVQIGALNFSSGKHSLPFMVGINPGFSGRPEGRQ